MALKTLTIIIKKKETLMALKTLTIIIKKKETLMALKTLTIKNKYTIKKIEYNYWQIFKKWKRLV